MKSLNKYAKINEYFYQNDKLINLNYLINIVNIELNVKYSKIIKLLYYNNIIQDKTI